MLKLIRKFESLFLFGRNLILQFFPTKNVFLLPDKWIMIALGQVKYNKCFSSKLSQHLVRKVLIICYSSQIYFSIVVKFIYWKLCWHILKMENRIQMFFLIGTTATFENCWCSWQVLRGVSTSTFWYYKHNYISFWFNITLDLHQCKEISIIDYEDYPVELSVVYMVRWMAADNMGAWIILFL